MKKRHSTVLAISVAFASIAGALHAGALFLFGEPSGFLKTFASFFALIYDVPARIFSRVVGHGYNFPFTEMTHAEFIADWLMYMIVSVLVWGGIGLVASQFVSLARSDRESE